MLPTRLTGPTHRRLPPFIYSEEDISGLMVACDSLFSIIGLRPHTMRTLIGLLVSTGLLRQARSLPWLTISNVGTN